MTQETRSCLWCNRPITVQPGQEHKKFCSTQHRNAWHGQQRKDALALLRKQQAQGGTDDKR